MYVNFTPKTAVYDMYVKVVRDMCTDVIFKCTFLEKIMDGSRNTQMDMC